MILLDITDITEIIGVILLKTPHLTGGATCDPPPPLGVEKCQSRWRVFPHYLCFPFNLLQLYLNTHKDMHIYLYTETMQVKINPKQKDASDGLP